MTIDKDRIISLYAELESDTAVARELGCSVVYVGRVMQQAGRKKLTGTRNPNARKNANKIIDHIICSGGTVKAAQAVLNLKVCDQLIYQEAKSRDICIGDYRYFKQSRGVMSVKEPGRFYRRDGQTYITSTCSHCGVASDLTYSQLFYKSRPVCPSCGAR